MSLIRVVLPHHLQNLANVSSEVRLELKGIASLGSVLDELEAKYPMLKGTIRDHVTLKRRPFLRFYGCENDLSNQPLDTPLPDTIVSGGEPLLIIGAISGG